MILGILDHGSRRVLALQGLPNKTAWTLLGLLFLTIGRFGVPRAVRTDNEPVFTSALFGAGLRLAGIRHQRTLPGCPWMNGRIERFFGTLKQYLNRLVPENGKALQSLLREFALWYNAVRPHQHLYGFTPDEVWFGVNPYLTPPKQVSYFEGWNGMLRGFYMRRQTLQMAPPYPVHGTQLAYRVQVRLNSAQHPFLGGNLHKNRKTPLNNLNPHRPDQSKFLKNYPSGLPVSLSGQLDGAA